MAERVGAVLGALAGGDLRSEGAAAEVAARVIARPTLLNALLVGLDHDEPLLRARTCMALEVISRTHPELLEPVTSRLVDIAEVDTVPQVRWHIAEVLANVDIDRPTARRALPTLLTFLDDKSKIVRHTAVLALGALGPKARPRQRKLASDKLRSLETGSKGFNRAVATALEALGEEPS